MNDLYGNLFDFNFDGKTDIIEEAMGFELFSDATVNFYGEEEARGNSFDFDIDDDDLDEDELADAFDAQQPESVSERRAKANSLSSDISCLIAELETLRSRIQDAKTDLETLLETEQDILLDLPDCLSCSDYESEIENAIDAIEDAIGCMDTADSDMDSSISELEAASAALSMLD